MPANHHGAVNSRKGVLDWSNFLKEAVLECHPQQAGRQTQISRFILDAIYGGISSNRNPGSPEHNNNAAAKQMHEDECFGNIN